MDLKIGRSSRSQCVSSEGVHIQVDAARIEGAQRTCIAGVAKETNGKKLSLGSRIAAQESPSEAEAKAALPALSIADRSTFN